MRQGHHVRQQRKPFQPSHQSCLEAQCTDCTGCRRRRSETRECLHPLPAFRQSNPRIIRNDTMSCSLRRAAFLFAGNTKPNSNAATGKASQNRSCLLFHGLTCLWLRNSGFALKRSRHHGKFHLIKFRKRSRRFAYALPVAALIVRS